MSNPIHHGFCGVVYDLTQFRQECLLAVISGKVSVHNPDETDLRLALKGVPGDELVIVLAHEPDVADFISKFPVDLQLSGRSHGGQVRLPLIGPAHLPPLGRKYQQGLRRVGPLTLYTNVGIGTMGLPIRLNCPPEVTLLTLRAPENDSSENTMN